MTQEIPKHNCVLGSVGLAALVGLVAMILCKMLVVMSWPGSIFVGLFVAAVLVALFLYVFCRTLPAVGSASEESDSSAAATATAAAGEKTAVVATAAVATASAETVPAAKPAPKAAAKKPAAKKAAPKKADAPAKTVSDEFRPEALKAARGGKADDLKLIKGVGPKTEKLCNSLGFYHFDQIASWKKKEAAWVDENLEGFRGRVTRDEWVKQAKVLAKGGSTEFSHKNAK